MQCFFKQFPAAVCIDTGAESSLVSERFAKSVGLDIQPTTQGAVQADVTTPLKTLGEVKNISITRGSHTFNLDALVIKGDLGSGIVAGEPFLELNDIAIRSAKKHIIIKGKDVLFPTLLLLLLNTHPYVEYRLMFVAHRSKVPCFLERVLC